MISSEICKIFKNTYFEEHLQTAASTYPVEKNVALLKKSKSHIF